VADAKQPRRRWAVDRRQLLILVVASVMVGSFALFVLWPEYRELATLDHAVRQWRWLLSQHGATRREGLFVSARIPELRKAQGRIERRLPRGPQVADFLQRMNTALAETPAVSHEVTRSGAAEAGSIPSVPLCLRLKGPFEAVYRGLGAVERLQRLSRFRRVRFSRTETDGQVLAEAALVIYYLLDDAPGDEGGAGEPAAARGRPASGRTEEQQTS